MQSKKKKHNVLRLHFLIQNKICIIVVLTVIKKYYITVVRNECEPKNIHNAKNPNGPKIGAFINFLNFFLIEETVFINFLLF